jgi:hypothetical protein
MIVLRGLVVFRKRRCRERFPSCAVISYRCRWLRGLLFLAFATCIATAGAIAVVLAWWHWLGKRLATE